MVTTLEDASDEDVVVNFAQIAYRSPSDSDGSSRTICRKMNGNEQYQGHEQIGFQDLVLCCNDQVCCGLLETSLCQTTSRCYRWSVGLFARQTFSARISGSTSRGVLLETQTVRSPVGYSDVATELTQPPPGAHPVTEAHSAANCISPW